MVTLSTGNVALVMLLLVSEKPPCIAILRDRRDEYFEGMCAPTSECLLHNMLLLKMLKSLIWF